MIDVGDKPITSRKATAQAVVRMQKQTLAAILQGDIVKGNVLETARLAGIIGAKQCPQLLPLCHPLPLDSVRLELHAEAGDSLYIRAECATRAATGVEMEALTACTSAALCVYDMCKSIDPNMRISDICLLDKSGGKSGKWQREAN